MLVGIDLRCIPAREEEVHRRPPAGDVLQHGTTFTPAWPGCTAPGDGWCVRLADVCACDLWNRIRLGGLQKEMHRPSMSMDIHLHCVPAK
jgi:hypothetical protein